MVVPNFTGPASRVTHRRRRLGAHRLAGRGHVRHADREVAEGGALLVLVDAVVVGQLDLALAGLLP